MRRELLRITWKQQRKAGHGRTKNSYIRYVAENEKHKHQLKTIEGTVLFDYLNKIRVSTKKEFENAIFIDGMYINDKLMYVTNFRIV